MDELEIELRMRQKMSAYFGNPALPEKPDSDAGEVVEDPGAAEDAGNSLFGKPAFFCKPWKSSAGSPLVAALDQMNRLDDLLFGSKETLAAMNARKPPAETTQTGRADRRASTLGGLGKISEEAEIERLLAERSRRKGQ